MFDVIVDGKVTEVRDEAKAGNYHSMVLLGTYIHRGEHTRKNLDLALRIYDYVISQRANHHFPSTILKALNQKGYVHSLRGENEDAAAMYKQWIQEVVSRPLEEWDCEHLISIIEWLWLYQQDNAADAEQ